MPDVHGFSVNSKPQTGWLAVTAYDHAPRSGSTLSDNTEEVQGSSWSMCQNNTIHLLQNRSIDPRAARQADDGYRKLGNEELSSSFALFDAVRGDFEE
jgi:hypothetical protein